ncbi:LuxR C-terminal-related transcriptional regulator [Nocardiopsis sp. NPDC049922]|uniref:helix-turn-helix transcriptional regulator n=1 Tax=Nocardiopsis sp. NPDC049922 TaxID=3155157 RepID=UPI0034065B2E
MRSAVFDASTSVTTGVLPLRGRDRELSEVLGVLGNAPVGGDTLVLVEGRVGSGRTRFLHECMELARERGYSVHTGAPRERGGPGIREPREGSGRRLVVVDDVDRMSGPEIDDLVFGRSRCGDGGVWLVARRPGTGTRRLDSRLSSPGRVPVRIGLGGLGARAVRELTADVLGARPSEDLVRLVGQANGNPQLVVELLRGLLEERAVLVNGADAWLVADQLPERLYRWAEAALDECSPECRQFLRVMAVLDGDTFPDRLRELLGVGPAELLPLVEEARCAGLLTTGPRLAFPSPLAHQVISDMVPEEWRLVMRRETDRAWTERTTPEVPADTAPDAAWTGPRPLTEQERSIVRLVAEGMTNRQVARRLTISPNTVNYHLKKLFRVYGASSRVELLGILRPYPGPIPSPGSGAVRPRP